jgi:hypothetical protein
VWSSNEKPQMPILTFESEALSTSKCEKSERINADTDIPELVRMLTDSSITFTAQQAEQEILFRDEIELSAQINRSPQIASRLLTARRWDKSTVLKEWFSGCNPNDGSAPIECTCSHCTLVRDARLKPQPVPNSKSCGICMSDLDLSDHFTLECGHKLHKECLQSYIGGWLAGAMQSTRAVTFSCPDCPISPCSFPVSVPPPTTLWARQLVCSPDVLHGWKAAASRMVLDSGVQRMVISGQSCTPGEWTGETFAWPGVTVDNVWQHYGTLRAERARLWSTAQGAEFRSCMNPTCSAVMKPLARQRPDAVCAACGARFCFDCRAPSHHAGLPCAAARAWAGFLDSPLGAPKDGFKVLDLAQAEPRRRAAQSAGLRLRFRRAWSTLRRLDAVVQRILAWPDGGPPTDGSAGSSAENAILAAAAELDDLLGTVTTAPTPLEKQRGRLFAALAAASWASTDAAADLVTGLGPAGMFGHGAQSRPDLTSEKQRLQAARQRVEGALGPPGAVGPSLGRPGEEVLQGLACLHSQVLPPPPSHIPPLPILTPCLAADPHTPPRSPRRTAPYSNESNPTLFLLCVVAASYSGCTH